MNLVVLRNVSTTNTRVFTWKIRTPMVSVEAADLATTAKLKMNMMLANSKTRIAESTLMKETKIMIICILPFTYDDLGMIKHLILFSVCQ